MYGSSRADQRGKEEETAKQTLSQAFLPIWQPGIWEPAKLSENITKEVEWEGGFNVKVIYGDFEFQYHTLQLEQYYIHALILLWSHMVVAKCSLFSFFAGQ